MNVALPELRVGDPLRRDALSVFPLFAEPNGNVVYRLSHEALADESVLIQEVNEGGSVPELLVENKGDERVLFLEGEELVGAKQNRVLNTSILVAAHSKIKVPVSCVERGRWRYKSRHFGSSGSHSPVKMRRKIRETVHQAVKEKRGHRSDQGQVWKEVACLHLAHGVSSGTAAMSDAFEAYEDHISSYREELTYVNGAVGAAVAIGDRVVSVDVFDKPATCEKVWDRMLSGVVFDSLEAGTAVPHASVADVERILGLVSDLPWEKAEAVGEGEEYRAESKTGDHASALALEKVVVHGSVIAS